VLGAGLGARALAGAAVVPAGDADLRVLAVGRLLERDLHRVAQVAAAEHLAATAATGPGAEHVTEDVAERFRKAAEALGPGAAAHVGIDPRMAVLVVRGPLLRIRQHLVGFLHLLELDLGILAVAMVAVRVVLHRQLAISLLDFLLARVLGDAEGFVIVAFGGHVR
jgi:hypothetical protein